MTTPDAESSLVLVDAYAQIYRCFFAIRDLTNSRGEPTNALFGVARFLLQLESNLPSRCGAFVFDKGKPQQRLTVLPAYKATRPPQPQEMRSQIPLIREWVEASGWAVLEEEGWEADDLIAAAVAHRGEHTTYIVSADKDLAQLVSAHVFLTVPRKKGILEVMGPDEVKTSYGVPPEAIADYLALLGDSSDNIPGVPGVGPKTAVNLLEQFGSVDALMADLDAVPQAGLREKLKDAREILDRNRQLVALKPDLPPSWPGLAALERKEPDWDTLLRLARDNDFRSLIKGIAEARDRSRSPTLF